MVMTGMRPRKHEVRGLEENAGNRVEASLALGWSLDGLRD